MYATSVKRKKELIFSSTFLRVERKHSDETICAIFDYQVMYSEMIQLPMAHDKLRIDDLLITFIHDFQTYKHDITIMRQLTSTRGFLS